MIYSKFLKAAALAASTTLFLTACDSNDSNGSLFSSKLRVVHASPDAPMVQLTVNGALFNSGAMYDYGQTTPQERFAPGMDTLAVEAVLPGGMTITAIPDTELTIEPDTNYDVFAVGGVADETLAPFVMSRSDTFDTSQVRIDVAHLAEGVPMVDVYATAPDADLSMATPIGTLAYQTEIDAPLIVPEGSYQIRITVAGDPDLNPVYDSGTLDLPAGADFTIAAVTNTQVASSGNPNSPVALLIVNGDTASTAYSVTDAAELRVVHNSADAPAVDIIVNNDLDPFVPNLAFPAATPYVSAPAAELNVKVLVAGTSDLDAAVINADVNLLNGLTYTVIALNDVANIEPLVLADDPRSVATEAKLRVIHGASSVDDEQDLVDLYLTAEGAGIAGATPVATNFPFLGDSGYLSVAPGTYDVTVTAAGSADAAIGPATITLEAGGVYTILARDLVNLTGLGVTLLDDFNLAQ